MQEEEEREHQEREERMRELRLEEQEERQEREKERQAIISGLVSPNHRLRLSVAPRNLSYPLSLFISPGIR